MESGRESSLFGISAEKTVLFRLQKKLLLVFEQHNRLSHWQAEDSWFVTGKVIHLHKGSYSPGKCERHLKSYISLRTKSQQSRNLTSVLTASPPSSSLCSTSREKTATQWMAWIIHWSVEIDHIGYPRICIKLNRPPLINKPYDTFINSNRFVRPPHHPINCVFDQIKVKLIKLLGDPLNACS